MTPSFTARTWAQLHDLVQRFETSPADTRSKEKRELRAGMRALGFSARELGLTRTTRADLDRLLEKGRVRVRG